MNWETIKTSKDAVLEGVSIEIDKSDSSTTSVILTDVNGLKLRVRLDSYSMKVEVPAKPKTEKKWELKGEFKGLPVEEKFDSEYEAKSRRDELEYGNEDIAISEIDVEIPF